MAFCIHSILSQTFQDFELLLIDDGSTDGSENLCDSLASENERIQVFHIKNSGPSNARNVGLKHAKGKYIYCMDSDDYLEKDFLETISNSLNEKPDVLRFQIRDIMDKYVSIVRTCEGLEIAKKIVERHYNNLKKINVMSRYYFETLNMATCAMIVINAAIERKESIGCHYRVN